MEDNIEKRKLITDLECRILKEMDNSMDVMQRIYAHLMTKENATDDISLYALEVLLANYKWVEVKEINEKINQMYEQIKEELLSWNVNRKNSEKETVPTNVNKE